MKLLTWLKNKTKTLSTSPPISMEELNSAYFKKRISLKKGLFLPKSQALRQLQREYWRAGREINFWTEYDKQLKEQLKTFFGMNSFNFL